MGRVVKHCEDICRGRKTPGRRPPKIRKSKASSRKRKAYSAGKKRKHKAQIGSWGDLGKSQGRTAKIGSWGDLGK